MAVSAITCHLLAHNSLGTMYMPMAEKKRVTKTVLSAPTSPRSCVAMTDSPRKIAARNAPSAGESPTLFASQAEPMAMRKAKRVKTSRLRVGAAMRTRWGKTYLLNKKNSSTKAPTTPNPLSVPSAMSLSPAGSSPSGVASAPTIRTSGTTATSWTSNTPRANRPWTESASARRCRTGNTTAVDESDSAAPSATAARHENSNTIASPMARAMVNTICRVPEMSAEMPSRLSRDQLNSRPMVNISSVTPSCARVLIVSPSAISPGVTETTTPASM